MFLGLVLVLFSCGGAETNWVCFGGAAGPISLPKAVFPFFAFAFEINSTGLICKRTFLSKNAKVKRVYFGARPISLPEAFSPFLLSFFKVNLICLNCYWIEVSLAFSLSSTKKKVGLKPFYNHRNWNASEKSSLALSQFIHVHLEASMK